MSKLVELDPGRLSEPAAEMKEFLESKIVDQRRAINRIVESFENFHSPIRVPGRPVFAGLFLGPTRVGKTLMGEVLAEYFFENRNALTKVECADLWEPHSIAKLIGPPPGYIGYDEEAWLSQKKIDRYAVEYEFRKMKKHDPTVRAMLAEIEKLQKAAAGTKDPKARLLARREVLLRVAEYNDYVDGVVAGKPPFSVIIFDELEKADKSIHNFLLEVTDKGRATMKGGGVTSFEYSFIIMTCNVASRAIADAARGRGRIGFMDLSLGASSQDPVYSEAMKEVRKAFPPEFLSRIEHNIVVFHPFSGKDLGEVLDMQITELIGRLAKKYPIELIIAPEVRSFILVEASDKPEYGAGIIKDKLATLLEGPLSRLINTRQIAVSDRIFVKLDGSRIVFLRSPDPKLLPEKLEDPD